MQLCAWAKQVRADMTTFRKLSKFLRECNKIMKTEKWKKEWDISSLEISEHLTPNAMSNFLYANAFSFVILLAFENYKVQKEIFKSNSE